jgi:hypothetical protein
MIEPTSETWSWPWRWLASILIGLHLVAIFVAPWSAPPPSSQFSQALAGWLQPYFKCIAMDNGYRFFAPDPGPSHLIRYEWENADGKTTLCQFPDLKRHFPRLLYHRHFMIAEMIYSLTYRTFDTEALAASPPAAQQEIAASQQLAQLLIQGVVRSLFREHPEAKRIRLFLVTHLIPSPQDLESGATLTDPRGYLEPVPLGEFTREPSPAGKKGDAAKNSQGNDRDPTWKRWTFEIHTPDRVRTPFKTVFATGRPTLNTVVGSFLGSAVRSLAHAVGGKVSLPGFVTLWGEALIILAEGALTMECCLP